MHPNFVSEHFQCLSTPQCMQTKNNCSWLQRSSLSVRSVTYSDSLKSNIPSHETALHVRHHEGSESSLFLTVFRSHSCAFLNFTLLLSSSTAVLRLIRLRRDLYLSSSNKIYIFSDLHVLSTPHRNPFNWTHGAWFLNSVSTRPLFASVVWSKLSHSCSDVSRFTIVWNV